MKRKMISLLCLYSSLSFAVPFNIAYVEVNDNKLVTAGCFINQNDKPFFNIVGIFAANINGNDPNAPYIYFNSQVAKLLNQTNQVSSLQAQGIKVVLTLLGNHENAGWSCMKNEKAIRNFANDIVNLVNQYKLDGIDIDDEYSSCLANDTSLIRISNAIKNHPKFKGKILSKALFDDQRYFTASYKGMKLADFLDFGWEMSYGGNPDYRLPPYVKYGMNKPSLALGISSNSGSQAARSATQYVMDKSFGGVMMYNVNYNSFGILKEIAQTEGQILKLTTDCEM